MRRLTKVQQKLVDAAFVRALKVEALKRQDNKCAYCRDLISRNKATADHIRPRSRGGTDSSDNILAACARCNVLKGNTSVAAFMRLVKNPQQRRGPFFYTWVRRRLNLRIERAERRIINSVRAA